ncbi:MAG: CPBP family intramembrane metalloprotease [Tannerella sp.]|jgi:membrane protease YdiL (CAAX protease family)|nr:CPBP family intramembrane metalloprotease [Tannerella sp.]
MKGIFAHRSVFFQLGVLFTALLIGYLIASVLTIILFQLLGSPLTMPMMEQPVSALLLTQFISAVCIFLFPAISTAWLCSEQPEQFLYIKSFHVDIRLLLLVALSMFLISPTVSITGYFNSLITFPEWMSPLEEWMKSTEEMATELTQKMLSQKGILALLANLMVVAIAAGITEEFFFRGALFSILRKSIHNHHVVIWTVAIVFSLFHFQFYGFIPRVILGAYLGYLLYWTKNIWIPVFAHFLNNAMAVIGMSDSALKDNVFFAETVPTEDLTWFSVVAVVCLVVFFFCVRMIRQIINRQEKALQQPED